MKKTFDKIEDGKSKIPIVPSQMIKIKIRLETIKKIYNDIRKRKKRNS